MSDKWYTEFNAVFLRSCTQFIGGTTNQGMYKQSNQNQLKVQWESVLVVQDGFCVVAFGEANFGTIKANMLMELRSLDQKSPSQ